MTAQELEILAINTIRTLSMDAVQKANSGHPGTAMALAPVVYTLWQRYIRHNPANPDWPNRDRFVLSVGHASMLLYSALHLTGYGVTLDDIKNFRQLRSRCAGHPEYGLAPGVETTTGPLGQGVANSVGMAIAERWLAATFNRPGLEIVNYKVFALCGDGDMMEGVSGEAASLAGHLGLSNLIWIYDSNNITIEGNTALAFTEDVGTRFMAYHWNVHRVGDANDLDLLTRTLDVATKETQRPTLIIVDSHIAYGSPNKQDTSGAHGEPLGDEEIRLTKQRYGWNPDLKFHVPEEVRLHMTEGAMTRGRQLEAEWNGRFKAYATAQPGPAMMWDQMQKRQLPPGWDSDIPTFPADAKGMAGRDASGKVLNAIAPKVPWLIGGSADLTPSTKTRLAEGGDFQRDSYAGRNLHFGVREHAMGAILNGITLSKLRPFGSGFLIFSDYCRPTLRLSALMEQPALYIFTHDSIGVGEDGPTHQPIEHLASLRAIPHLDVIRPGDANEVAVAWRYIMQTTNRPMALILSRQALPTFDRTKFGAAEGLLRGGYILADSDGAPEVILIGTGSEVQLCVGAYEQLTREGIKARVVSLPCWSLFERQGDSYWNTVLPATVRARVAVEAASSFGWRRYTGREEEGSVIARRDFGASAPLKELLKEFGFTVEMVIQEAKRVLKR
jgi:transketolase